MKNKAYDYPLQYDEHMIHVPKKHNPPVLDENYPYRDLSFRGRLSRFFTYFILHVIGFPLIWLLTGLKIKGRKNLKTHKELLKNGAISLCNHVHMWDMVCLTKALRPIKSYTPGWAGNMVGPNAALIRGIGGMPISDTLKGIKRLSDTMDEILDEGKWLHFYPESAMWFYYDAIRPFKKGAFTLAVKHNKPVLPVCINYRPAKGLRKIFRRGNPFLTINIGEPLLPDLTLQKHDAAVDLLTRCRAAMHKLGDFKRTISQESLTRLA